MGTNMGLWKMRRTGSWPFIIGVNGAQLLRLEPYMRQRCDQQRIAALPAFHLYTIRDETHSSSDGQRMETQIDTSMPALAKIFWFTERREQLHAGGQPCADQRQDHRTHEHESHYVFDLLYNNTSDIKPERHSTDTHGTNQVNFWILHTFGYRFAPRYRDLHKKIDTLVGPASHHYGDFLIKPSRQRRRAD